MKCQTTTQPRLESSYLINLIYIDQASFDWSQGFSVADL